MTFGRAVKKAIKEYLRQYGFKYKDYSFRTPHNEDMTFYFYYADETHFRPQYYYVKMAAKITSLHLSNILNDLTEGKLYYMDNPSYVGPMFQMTTTGTDIIHSEFFGSRDMEENMAEFKHVFETTILPIYEKYSCQKTLFTCAIHDKPAIKWCRIAQHYIPLAYYFESRFDEMFQYIDERLNFFKENLEEAPNLSEQIDVFSTMRKNLQIWIEEKRTFKVDDEYMPVFK